jgi:hypothetical protein
VETKEGSRSNATQSERELGVARMSINKRDNAKRVLGDELGMRLLLMWTVKTGVSMIKPLSK